MTFTLASIITLALLTLVLGLVAYHLLGRLEHLEQAVQGGFEAPSTRLTREQFERRFRFAHARARLARSVETGVVLVVGAEFDPASELAMTIDHLPRKDLLTVCSLSELAETHAIAAEALGVSTTPYLFVVDEQRIRTAQPIAGTNDLLDALATHTS